MTFFEVLTRCSSWLNRSKNSPAPRKQIIPIALPDKRSCDEGKRFCSWTCYGDGSLAIKKVIISSKDWCNFRYCLFNNLSSHSQFNSWNRHPSLIITFPTGTATSSVIAFWWASIGGRERRSTAYHAVGFNSESKLADRKPSHVLHVFRHNQNWKKANICLRFQAPCFETARRLRGDCRGSRPGKRGTPFILFIFGAEHNHDSTSSCSLLLLLRLQFPLREEFLCGFLTCRYLQETNCSIKGNIRHRKCRRRRRCNLQCCRGSVCVSGDFNTLSSSGEVHKNTRRRKFSAARLSTIVKRHIYINEKLDSEISVSVVNASLLNFWLTSLEWKCKRPLLALHLQLLQ